MLNIMFELVMLACLKCQYIRFDIIEIPSQRHGSPGSLWVWWVGGNLPGKGYDSPQTFKECLTMKT